MSDEISLSSSKKLVFVLWPTRSGRIDSFRVFLSKGLTYDNLVSEIKKLRPTRRLPDDFQIHTTGKKSHVVFTDEHVKSLPYGGSLLSPSV